MKQKITYYLLVLMVSTILLSCGKNNHSDSKNGRWYTAEQVSMGKQVFKQNCASCHGNDAQGFFNWNKPSADGSYPPPPLNGTAHTWHHSLKQLKKTIKNGGVEFGGKMPPFKQKLSDEQIEFVIAYFSSKWNDKIYQAWISRNGLK